MLTQGGRVDLLVAIERQLSWLAGVQANALAALAADDLAGSDDRQWVREEVACALRQHPATAQAKLHDAVDLDRLPGTRRLLFTGEIPPRRAQVMVGECRRLEPDQVAAVEGRLLARASEQTVANLARSVRRAVLRIAPKPAEQALRDALAERRVGARPDVDGMSWFSAYLPVEGCAALMTALTALATSTDAGDGRRLDQRRADALVELALHASNDPTLPRAHGARPAVNITVALSTLLGLDDQPGDLAGHGPIPAPLARRIAADQTGTWRRIITDPVTGQVLDHGTTRYRPPRELTDYVTARDQQCVYPPCTIPASRCELDHREPAQQDGPTSAANLNPLCKRHHIAKHEAGWHVTRDDSTGDYAWTSPTGHIYITRPPDLTQDLGWQADQPDITPSGPNDRRPPNGTVL